MKLNWELIDNFSRLYEIDRLSKEKLVVIFKHSTRCPVSKRAFLDFEEDFTENDNIKLFYLDVINQKYLSNTIALQYKVKHQSPQLIVIKNGKEIFNASHKNIQAEELTAL